MVSKSGFICDGCSKSIKVGAEAVQVRQGVIDQGKHGQSDDFNADTDLAYYHSKVCYAWALK